MKTNKMIHKLKLVSVIAVVMVMGLVTAAVANAQALDFTANYTVDLTSPNVDLTINSGSGATSLVVNAGNIQVVVPNTDTFTVTATDSQLADSGVTTASVARSCSGTTETLVITGGTGGETITITPAGGACNNTGSGGGGGGGSSSGSANAAAPAAPATPGVPAVPADPAARQALIDSIRAKINALLAQIAALPNQAGGAVTPPGATISAFARGLGRGQMGNDVRNLQNWLVTNGHGSFMSTGYFGPLTEAALGRFQLKQGIVTSTSDPGYGFLGPKTRAAINAMLAAQ